jgi:hypothetical protein
MSPRGYAVATIAGWLLTVWGFADLAGRWVWGPGTGLLLLGGIGLRRAAELLWLGVQKNEEPEKE